MRNGIILIIIKMTILMSNQLHKYKILNSRLQKQGALPSISLPGQPKFVFGWEAAQSVQRSMAFVMTRPGFET